MAIRTLSLMMKGLMRPLMPEAFTPENEDADDEDYMEDAREVRPSEPRLRMRGKQKKADPMEELETRYIAMLRTCPIEECIQRLIREG